MKKTTLQIVKEMEQALERAEIDCSEYFHDDFDWIAKIGCGTKRGLDEFERAWYKPFRDAFGDRHFATEHYLEDGNWAACFGHCEATHHGDFMGIAATGKQVEIRYMDFWKVVDGKITDNWVMVDFPHVMAQLGVDLFQGHGWEKYDNGEKHP